MKAKIVLLLLLSGLLGQSLLAQKGLRIGLSTYGQMGFSQALDPAPAGLSPSVFLRPGFAGSVRWSIGGPFFAETGLWIQSHGSRYRYTPDFGTQAGNPNFLVANSRAGVPAIPIWLTYSPDARSSHPIFLSLGASLLLNPLLDSRVFITSTYSGGTSDTLFTRTSSIVNPFTTFAISGKAEYTFWQKKGHSFAAKFAFQKGFSQIHQATFEYALNSPNYQNIYRRRSQGDLIAVGLTYWYFRRHPDRLKKG